jgi:hypothetical protein
VPDGKFSAAGKWRRKKSKHICLTLITQVTMTLDYSFLHDEHREFFNIGHLIPPAVIHLRRIRLVVVETSRKLDVSEIRKPPARSPGKNTARPSTCLYRHEMYEEDTCDRMNVIVVPKRCGGTRDKPKAGFPSHNLGDL